MSIGLHVTPPVSQTHGLPQVTIKQKKNQCLLYKFVYYTSLIQNFHEAKQNKPIFTEVLKEFTLIQVVMCHYE